MFFGAHEKFEQGLYFEALELFRATKNDADDRIRYWSNIFIGRCMDGLNMPGSLEHYKEAHVVFPGRAEALHEIGKFYYKTGDLITSEKFLQMAKSCNPGVVCIRYEHDKYFERNHELLIDIYVHQSRYNDAEELLYTLKQNGSKEHYDYNRVNYNHLFARHYNNVFIEFAKVKAVNAKKELVIQLPDGYDGLGDQLVFSHLPELAKKTGRYEKVYVSEFNKYGRPEYKDLVWKMNPFVDGFVDLPGTFTNRIQFARILEKWIDPMPGLNLLDSMMLLHDIDDGERDHKPVCYYKLRKRTDLDDISEKTILDIGSRTISTKDFNVDVFLQELEKQGCVPDLFIVSKGLTNSMDVDKEKSITPEDIYDWCDIMMSCKEYVCFNSGGYWLSSALGVKGSHVWIKEKNLPAWSFLDHRNIHMSLATICQ
jgi:hypothetical protein